MDLLLDTHTLIWFLENNPQLNTTAKSAIENAGNKVAVSIVSFWEISIKIQIGKLK